MISGEVAKMILSEAQNKLHEDFINYDRGLIKKEELSKESIKYIEKVRKEYLSFIKGITPYSSLCNDAKFKANNKVTRAYMRRYIIETNKSINGMAQSTNGYNLNDNLKYSESFIASTINSAINSVFEKITNVEANLDYLSIYGLYALNTFKEIVLNEYNSFEKGTLTENSVSFKQSLNNAKRLFETEIKNKNINNKEIYHLNTPLSATSAKNILKNLSNEDINTCIKNCEFNKLLLEKFKTSDFYINETINTEIDKEIKQPTTYYDEPFGYILEYEHGNYTRFNRPYYGDVYRHDPNSNDGDGFIYVETVTPEDEDELTKK